MSQTDPSSTPTPQVGDDAVRAKTGRGWEEWFTLLDQAGAAGMTHPQIVAVLREQHGVEPWWQQTVAVTYEKARGLRQKHQKPGGYEISASKTVPVPVEALFRAWHQEERRTRWLPEPVEVRKATPPRSLRITWSDGHTHVDVYLVAKAADRSQISLQHTKLPDAEAAEQFKGFWKEALARLSRFLEEEQAAEGGPAAATVGDAG